jgi:hypothetical protein
MKTATRSEAKSAADSDGQQPVTYWLQTKLAVRAKPNELQRRIIWLSIDQHQVGLDVAIPVILPLARKRMVAVPRL